MLDRIKALYALPFSYDGIAYILDANCEVVADFHGAPGEALVGRNKGGTGLLRPRGWRRIQYLKDGAALHDACSAYLLSLVPEEQRNNPEACVKLFNDAWIRYMHRDLPRPYQYTISSPTEGCVKYLPEDERYEVRAVEWPWFACADQNDPEIAYNKLATRISELVITRMAAGKPLPEPTGDRWVVVFDDGRLVLDEVFCSEEILCWEVGACREDFESLGYQVICLDKG